MYAPDPSRGRILRRQPRTLIRSLDGTDPPPIPFGSGYHIRADEAILLIAVKR